MKKEDFPAGHSMDTDWFAVDKDGNIAVFDSGSEGPVPIEIESQTHRFELFENYTKSITPALKQLYLNEEAIEALIKKCDFFTLEQIIMEEYTLDGCLILLNEGKKWEDLNFETALLKNGDFALCLSPTVPLYIISDIYDMKKEFVAAIKNRVIAKGCKFNSDLDYYERDNSIGMRDLGIFVYDNDNWYKKPYYSIHTPEIPLKANQFIPDLATKIPFFKDITFKNQYYIQPMEFISCERYGSGEEGEVEYTKVMSSDNENEYCLLSVSDQIYNRTNLSKCNKCYPQQTAYSLSHSGLLKTYRDYPPILIVEDYYFYHHKKWDRYESLSKTINNALNISKKDYTTAFCVKCFIFADRDKNQDIQISDLKEKFQNCYPHFNMEVAVLQPLLMIAIGEKVIKLLKTQYEITGFSKAPCLCSITIEGKQYSLLAVNDSLQKELLTNYLTGKSDEIKVILSQPRNLPPPKPRVIKIEEDDDD